jgi:hypothetical protein
MKTEPKNIEVLVRQELDKIKAEKSNSHRKGWNAFYSCLGLFVFAFLVSAIVWAASWGIVELGILIYKDHHRLDGFATQEQLTNVKTEIDYSTAEIWEHSHDEDKQIADLDARVKALEYSPANEGGGTIEPMTNDLYYECVSNGIVLQNGYGTNYIYGH